MITNPETIAVNQSSICNREVLRSADEACWVTNGPVNGSRYIALFIRSDQPRRVVYREGDDSWFPRDSWSRRDLGEFASVRYQRYLYIRDPDGTEELNDHAADTDEFKNLASNPELASVKARPAKGIPKHREESLGGN